MTLKTTTKTYMSSILTTIHGRELNLEDKYLPLEMGTQHLYIVTI